MTILQSIVRTSALLVTTFGLSALGAGCLTDIEEPEVGVDSQQITVPGGGGPTSTPSCALDDDCPECNNAYTLAYTTMFSPPPPGAPADTAEDKLAKCYQVGEMVYTDSFNCTDFTKWFLRCAQDQGLDAYGLSMWCKDCDSGKSKAHRVVVYKKGNQWCPGEPQRQTGGEATSCCKPTKAAAEECALNQYCAGDFPDRDTTRPGFEGCNPDGTTARSCAECMTEGCTAAEEAQVCSILGIVDPETADIASCAEKPTNAACTACCFAKFPNNPNERCTGEAGCAGKP